MGHLFDDWITPVMVLAGTLSGVGLGSLVYRRLDHHRFHRIALYLLLASRIGLEVNR
jgi:hypothetical protein